MDIFKGVGIEITLPHPDNFLKIKETLTRIGISSKRGDKLYQSCHILHKQGRYVILHFKELFILDGKTNTLTEEDVLRRNLIAIMLREWKLIEFPEKLETTSIQIKIVPFKEKSNWALISKYNIGKK